MKNSSEHTKGMLAVFLTALLWSSGGLFIKLITLNPMQISFFRCLIAAIVFAILFRQKILKLNPLALLNSISYAAVLIFFVIATKTTTAANAIFLQSTAPIYVLIFEPLLTKTKWEKINIVTIAVCFIGMILFFMGDLTPGDIKGNLAALFAGVAFAAFFLGMKKNDKQYGEASIFYGNVIVATVCIPFLFEMHSLTFSDFWKLTFLGVFQIAFAYALFSYGIKRILAVEASIISMLEPVLNPIWVFFGYGEAPSLYAIIGGVIIISAITIRTLIAGAPALKRKFTT
ncbi:DMT superfamily drug/metabolite permease [Ignavibacterium album JCM 16511]|uniref:DMT superfamily drug/metabolite permease n=1 Tax=Ignavibacterium album (strain DSM 19864 / JCM 16511 / NBRC 101810 / Mat9-16) TaxID=945713 RepID=I0AJ00_IGNAJ|nr:DMT family transporter [Ignavibacterium album]AFH48957.1 DMT superfamily drug/metabolite permease [Ignavibacterium album JCM 16511]